MTSLSHLLSSSQYDFPDPLTCDPQGLGLVAVGGDLSPATLISAYSQGLFPWFNEDEPIAWWSPEPRCVIEPACYQPSKSLQRSAKRASWHITVNQAFNEVIHSCSLPRSYSEDTWIHEDMIEAYLALHQLGFAHSIEVWEAASQGRRLIGGLYGLKIGKIYFGESMFHHVSNASKVAFWALMRLCEMSNMPLVDCQLPNAHLLSLGAATQPRALFLSKLSQLIHQPTISWEASNLDPISSRALLDKTAWSESKPTK